MIVIVSYFLLYYYCPGTLALTYSKKLIFIFFIFRSQSLSSIISRSLLRLVFWTIPILPPCYCFATVPLLLLCTAAASSCLHPSWSAARLSTLTSSIGIVCSRLEPSKLV